MIRHYALGFFATSLLLFSGLSSGQAVLTLSAPGQPAASAGQFTVAGNASGFLNVETWFNGAEIARATPDSSGGFSMAVNTSNIPDGPQAFVVHAWNSPPHTPFTQQAQTPLTVTVEKASSTPSSTPSSSPTSVGTDLLTLSAPGQPATSTGQFTVAGDASGFLNVETWFNGAEIARAAPDSSGAFSMVVNTSNIPNGPQAFVVHAWNSPPHTPFTQQAQTPLTITVTKANSTPPEVSKAPLTVSAPANHSSVAGQMTLSGSTSGMANVEVSFNGILLARTAPAASGAYQATFSTLSLPDGPQTLVVNAWNAPAGHPSTVTSQENLTVNVANGSINIVNYGAVADGVTDNYNAITAAIAAAQARGVAVFVPAGTFAYGNVLRLTSVKMFGVGNASVLYALNWADESIFMYGSGTQVRQLALAGVTAPARVAPWEATRITLFGATNFVIDHVTITSSAAAGIQTAMLTNHGIISNTSVSNTLADSIHMTGGASYIVVENNHVQNSGDDGIAVVSYLEDNTPTSNITAMNNEVQNNLNGRSMSVVGGSNVTYENNFLEDNAAAACLYFAQEGSWNTFGDTNVVGENNTLVSCGNPSIGHGAVMIVTTGSGTNSGIQLLNNDIEQDGNAGVRVFGSNQNVTLTNNEVTGANPAWDIEDAVNFTPYVSGTAGFVTPLTLPIP
jgi:hypothetical protein